MKYSVVRAVRPMAASSVVRDRPCRERMKMRYGGSRVGKPVMPSIAGICPAMMVRADPAMKADSAVSGMRSTIHPHRIRPTNNTMLPARMAKAEAMTWAGTSGNAVLMSATTPPVS